MSRQAAFGVAGSLALLAAIAAVVCLPLRGAEGPKAASSAAAPAAKGPADEPPPGTYPVPPPPFSEGIFPCSSCHNKDFPANKTRRKLEAAHDEIQLRHGERMWCLDCHNADARDTLRSASGEPIQFAESYKLCGQCHGEKYRDWKAGVHGKRSGDWNGRKTYLLCVHCHNPHSPRFKSVKPEPPPARPEHIRRGGERHGND